MNPEILVAVVCLLGVFVQLVVPGADPTRDDE